MARKRMLSSEIINTDDFINLSPTSQAIYLHLNMKADDDGVVDSWRTVVRLIRGRREHVEALLNSGYVIKLESGAMLITDWNIHNKIRFDRYTKSRYSDELTKLHLNSDGRYVVV